MLKHSDEKEKTEFALRVINFINPKYVNPKVEMKPDIEKCKNFAAKSSLTKDEFMLALDMTSRKQLFYIDLKKELQNPEYTGDLVKYYREIDLGVLGEIEAAYIQFKREDVKYGNGKKILSEFLNPEKQISPEEAKETRKRTMKMLLDAVEKNKPCVHAFLFFDYVIKKGGLKSFLANKEAQKIVVNRKMKEIIITEKRKQKSALFNSFEIMHLLKFFNNNENEILITVKTAYDLLQSKAIVEVKNELAYNWFKKQFQKNANRK